MEQFEWGWLPGCHSRHTAHSFPSPFHLASAAVFLAAEGSLRPRKTTTPLSVNVFLPWLLGPLQSLPGFLATLSPSPWCSCVTTLALYTLILCSGGKVVLRAPFIFSVLSAPSPTSSAARCVQYSVFKANLVISNRSGFSCWWPLCLPSCSSLHSGSDHLTIPYQHITKTFQFYLLRTWVYSFSPHYTLGIAILSLLGLC